MNKEILRLAIPNILSNISIPLLSSVDTALMGRLSDVHIGAVGIGSMIFNFIYWNFGFLRMGTTGLTAQAFGKGNKAEMITSLARSSLLALAIAFVILLAQSGFENAGVWFMRASGDLDPLVRQYFGIRIWAAPATLLSYAIIGWFFGMQNAIYPLILTILVNVVNIVLSYTFVHLWGWEVEGVAYGTVVAQYAGLFFAVLLLIIKYRQFYEFLKWELILHLEDLIKFLKLNSDIFIRTFFLTFAFGFFYSQSTSFGDEMLAVNVILLQYVNWMSYGIDGFAFAAESLVGKYYGANDNVKLLLAIKLSFVWSFALAFLICLAYLVAGDWLLDIFTNQANVITASKPYLFWIIIFPVIGVACYIWDGIYIGLTASVAMRNSMALSLAVYLISFIILKPIFGNHGLWLSLLIFLAARGLFQWYLFAKRGFALQ